MKHSFKRGLFSSQFAAFASAAFLTAWSVYFMSRPFHFPFHVMASMFFGDRYLSDYGLKEKLHIATTHFHPISFLTGVITHHIFAAVWGGVFAFAFKMMNIRSLQQSLMLGGGLLSGGFALHHFLVTPLVRLFRHSDALSRHIPLSVDLGSHLIFGLALGFAYYSLQDDSSFFSKITSPIRSLFLMGRNEYREIKHQMKAKGYMPSSDQSNTRFVKSDNYTD